MSEMEAKSERRWTLEAARAILDDVRRRTESAVAEVDPMLAERDSAPEGGPERAELDLRIQRRISVWVRSMEALGLEVKGLWLVDFDNGSGYYCWTWPEEKLEYFHGYDDGFDGRTRIQ
jgi:hypothetical protein